jgi:hypothetical protein
MQARPLEGLQPHQAQKNMASHLDLVSSIPIVESTKTINGVDGTQIERVPQVAYERSIFVNDSRCCIAQHDVWAAVQDFDASLE